MKLAAIDVTSHELERTLSAARAVSTAAMESLPWRDSYSWDQINHMGDLIAAVTLLLELAEAQSRALEPALRTAA